jgi:hypothetical protein
MIVFNDDREVQKWVLGLPAYTTVMPGVKIVACPELIEPGKTLQIADERAAEEVMQYIVSKVRNQIPPPMIVNPSEIPNS